MKDVESLEAKKILIHGIENTLDIKFKGITEREMDAFIEHNFREYKNHNDYIFRDMYDFTEDGW